MSSRHINWFLLIVVSLFLAIACERKLEIHEDQLSILGTFAQISIVGMTTEAAGSAARAAEEDLKALNAIGYTFEQESELQRLNEAIAGRRAMEVSDELLQLLQHAGSLSAASNGLFNPAAGELTALWEFHCDKEECTDTRYSDEVQKLVSARVATLIKNHPSMQDMLYRGNRASSRNRYVKLELGDIIRGYALDKSIAHLRNKGVENAMINIGGSVHTIGTRGDHAWWIGIPDNTGKHHIGYIETRDDEAVFTAYALDRSLGKEDFIYRHVVDPRTGMPVEHILSVTVVHENATTANAAATALMVAGPDNWKAAADSMKAQAFLMIAGDGTIYTSPAIDHRIHWNQGVTHRHLVP